MVSRSRGPPYEKIACVPLKIFNVCWLNTLEQINIFALARKKKVVKYVVLKEADDSELRLSRESGMYYIEY